MQRLAVFCLSLKGATVDRARVGRQGGGCLAGFLALGKDLLDVVVVCHAVSIGGRGGVCVTPCATASGGLVVGVADFLLHTIEDLLIHPVGAFLMEADQIVEHCHLVSSKGGQHVVAVMHWVFVGVFVVDGVSLQGHECVVLKECAVYPLTHASVTVDQQVQHITAAAGVTRYAARAPLHDGSPSERREDNTLTGRRGTLHVHEHRQVSDGEVGEGHQSFG